MKMQCLVDCGWIAVDLEIEESSVKQLRPPFGGGGLFIKCLESLDYICVLALQVVTKR